MRWHGNYCLDVGSGDNWEGYNDRPCTFCGWVFREGAD